MPTLLERYESKILRLGEDECHLWIGALNPDGYGLIFLDGWAQLAHRVGWSIWKGKIPSGLHVLHSCDNPPCQNDNHWHLGTHQQNMKERNERGRSASMPGALNPNAKVDESTVLAIRSEYVKGKKGGVTALGSKYKLSKSQVHNIVTGTSW